jgi:hypothetical protein
MHNIGTLMAGGTLPTGVWMISSHEENSYGRYYHLIGISASNQGKKIHRYPDGAPGIYPEGTLGTARVIEGILSFEEKI